MPTPPTVRPGAVLTVVSAAAFLSSLDLFIVNIAFPAIRAEFTGTDLAQLSWLLNGYTVVFAALLALSGRLADRFGHRRVFLTGLVVFTVASAACAAGPTVGAIVAARAVQAVGAALVMPTSLSLLLTAYPPQRRTAAVSTWASIGAMAAALGPPLGGLLVEVSWRWVFLVNVPFGIAAFVAGLRVLREPDTPRTGMPDLVAAAALVVGVGGLAYGLVRAPEQGWLSTEVLVAFAVAVIGSAATVWRARRHPVPALDLAVLRTPAMAWASVAMLVFTTGFAAMLVVNVLFLTGTWGWSTVRAGFAMAVGPLVVVVVARLAARLTGRLGRGPVATLGGVAFGLAGLWWTLRLGTDVDFVAGLLPGNVLSGIGVGLLLPTLSSVVGATLPAAQWGSGSSLINTARQVGSVLGVAVLVAVVGARTSGAPGELGQLREGWILIAGCGALVVLAGLALGAVERRAASEHRATPEPGTAAVPSAPVPEPKGPSVSGVARDQRGAPVPGAVATLVDARGRGVGRAVSDRSGRFHVPVAGAAGHGVLVVGSAGRRPLTRRVALADRTHLELVLADRSPAVAPSTTDATGTTMTPVTSSAERVR